MTAIDWTPDELDRIGRADELELSSRRPDGSLRPFVTIWAVRAADEVYVRSAYGPSNGWFRRALASGTGRIRAGGVERDVRFDAPGAETTEPVSDAYRAKYAGYGAAMVGSVVSPEAQRSTLRVVAA